MAAKAPAAATGIATDQSPSFSLPLRFFLFGCAGYTATALAVAVFGAELATGGTWSPRLLALTHALALGFILPMIMGACYQLVPVVLLATIRHERCGQLGFWPYAAGVVLLVAGFWGWSPALLAAGGALVTLGLAVFLLVLALSLARGADGGEVGGFFFASLGALIAAIAVGLVRLAGFAAPALAVPLPNGLVAHAGLATLGCATLLIYGVSYRLIPMFSVGRESHRLAKPVLLLGGLGAGAIGAGALTGVSLAVPIGMVAVAIGAWLWAFDAWTLFASRTRRRLDTGLTYAATAIGHLLLASVLGVWLAWGAAPDGAAAGRLAIAWAVLGLVGWISFSILGYFHKILPFLAWYHRYSSLLGKRQVPLIRDLFDEKSAWAGYWASQAGLAALLAAIWLGLPWAAQVGGALLLVGALATLKVVRECLTR